MVEIDARTLVVSLQAVYECVNRYTALLESETLRDPENIEEMLYDYRRALKALEGAYEEEVQKGEDLPPIEKILIEKQT